MLNYWMKIGLTALVFVILIASFGCSNPGANPIIPISPTDNPTRETDGHAVLGAYTFTIDPVTKEAQVLPRRDADVHYDITDMLFPPQCPDCVGVHFQGIQPGTNVHLIQVNVRNPSIYTAYDVRVIILWDDIDGRDLVNNEAYTELYDDGGTKTKNQFITIKDLLDQTNAFPAGAIKSTVLHIDFPKPANYNVNFVVECSFPGNSKDPWLISTEDVSNPVDLDGIIPATVNCRVSDHQDDVTSVTVDFSSLGFAEPIALHNTTGNQWEVEISNVNHKPAGYYTGIIEARDVTNKWPLFDYVQCVVQENLSPYVYVDSNYSGSSNGSEQKPYQTIMAGMNNSIPGQTVMVKEGTYIENVDLDNNVHIKGYGTFPPVIAGQGESLVYAGPFADNAVMENFILQGNGTTVSYGIRGVQTSNVEFRSIDFVSTGSAKSFTQAVRVEGSDGFTLADARFQNLKATGGAPILLSFNQTSNILLESVLVKNFQFSPGGSFTNGTGAVIYLSQCDATVIKQTLIGGVSGAISQFTNLEFAGIRMNSGGNIDIKNTLIYGLTPTGTTNLKLAGVTVNGVNGYSLYNCTFDSIGYGTQSKGDTYGSNLLFGTPGDVVNNIITHINAPSSGDGNGVYSGHAVSQVYSDVWKTGKDDTFRYEGSAGEGIGGLNIDPKYVNPDGGDYHLQAGSPCLSTGMGGAQMGAYGGPEPLDLP